MIGQDLHHLPVLLREAMRTPINHLDLVAETSREQRNAIGKKAFEGEHVAFPCSKVDAVIGHESAVLADLPRLILTRNRVLFQLKRTIRRLACSFGTRGIRLAGRMS